MRSAKSCSLLSESKSEKWFAVCLQEVSQKEMREIECDGATMWLAKGRPNKNGKGGDSTGLGMVLCRDTMQAWKEMVVAEGRWII
jgi:hypothetical protein